MESTMATRNSDENEGEDIARWQKLVELRPEKGLREAGWSQESTDLLLTFLDSDDDVRLYVRHLFLEKLRKKFSNIKDGVAMMLAFVGRTRTPEYSSIEIWGHRYSLGCDMTKREATALCVNLASSRTICSLQLFDSDFLLLDQQIRTLFFNALKTNSVLHDLKFTRCGLLDEGVRTLADYLCSNTCLETLALHGSGCGIEGASFLSDALSQNITLKKLKLSGEKMGKDGMKKLLLPLSLEPTALDERRNTTLQSISFHEMTSDDFCVDSIARMLVVNTTLAELVLAGITLDVEDWINKFFPALKENKTLKRLEIYRSEGLDDPAVRSVVINLIKKREIAVEKIVLYNVSWNSEVQEELRINRIYRDKLRDMPMATPTSHRIILCGREYAGKTTIRNTMDYAAHGMSFNQFFNMGFKTLLKAFPKIRQFLFGNNAFKELADRTRGFDILVFKKEPRTSMWDFAGQKVFYALHDYMFPKANNSYFLYVCSCRRPPPTSTDLKGALTTEREMRDDCSYWLRFIASNCKRNQVNSRGEDLELPHVKFVLTKIDTLERLEEIQSVAWAKKVVSDLRKEFDGMIELDERVVAMNAHNRQAVEDMTDKVCAELQRIVRKEEVYAICQDVQSAFNTWVEKYPSKPVMRKEEYHEICERIGKLDAIKEEAMLDYLNDMGEIIYPKGLGCKNYDGDIFYPNALDFIIVQPRWFGMNILGSLVDAFEEASDSLQRPWISNCLSGQQNAPPRPAPPKEGTTNRNYVQQLLLYALHTMDAEQEVGMSVEKLVQLMINLEICFEKDPNEQDSELFLPSLFGDKDDRADKGRRQLEWSRRSGKLVFLGRRLQCKEVSTTFLTPGFFPRVQVHLLRYMQEKSWTSKQGFEMGRNLIRFTENGNDVCVEYSGSTDYFIDILVRSTQPHARALEFIRKHVIEKIRSFCASPEGCQGVELVEAVIRPICVEKLHLCVARKPQAVLVSKLEEEAREEGPEYEHTWAVHIHGEEPGNSVRELLEGVPESRATAGPSTSRASEEKSKPLDFYVREDRGVLSKLRTSVSLAGLKPFKIHLYCSHEDRRCEVQNHPGKSFTLPRKSSWNPSRLKPVFDFLSSQVSIGFNPGALLELFLDPGDIPNFDTRTLGELQDTDQPPTQLLEDIIRLNGCLEEIVNVKDKEFHYAFGLHKVVQPETGKIIGWYCDEHFNRALKENRGRNRR